MKSLVALDFDFGPQLENAIRDCVGREEAFCVLDRRLSRTRRGEELLLLGATHLLDANGRRALDQGRAVEEGIGLVMLTSGSSGTPKAAQLEWAALRASARLTQQTLRGDTAPVWYPCLPANHIGGLAVLLRAVLDDASLLWGDADSLDTAPSRGASHVSVVRAQLRRHDLSGFTKVLLGGAKPPEELADNVVTTWGMTETGSGVVYDGYPLEGVELATVDGELCVRTPTLFRSYRGTPRPHVVGPDGRDDWFPTGDAAALDRGRLHVRGRLGFVINTGGEKLWPEDLEAALSPIAGVRDVAVTSVEDEEWGEKVVVLLVTDGSKVDDRIRETANEMVGPWAKPKEIRYVTAIPRTANGKIRRGELGNLH